MLFSGNITLLFGHRTPEGAQISRTVEQIDFLTESVALAFFEDPIIDEVAYEKGFIEPICLDENPGTRLGPLTRVARIEEEKGLFFNFKLVKNDIRSIL